MAEMIQKIEISHKTIIFTIVVILSLGLVYYIRDIILQLFVALLLMAILEPIVTRLEKLRIPRAISVVITYILVLGIFGGAIAFIVPPLVSQTGSFISTLTSSLGGSSVASYVSSQGLGSFFSTLGGVPSQVLKFTYSLFNNIFAVITVLVFAFYFLLSREKLVDQLGFLFGEERKRLLGKFIDLLETRLGGWARGQLILMILIGVLTYIGLLIIGVPFALPLAILAGLFEIVPYLGPIISAIPSVIIGFGVSPLTGVGVAAMFFLIQQLENTVFVPKVMAKSAGVSPIIVLVALAVGARLAGVVGAIISVPIVLMLKVVSEMFFAEGDKPDSVLKRSSV